MLIANEDDNARLVLASGSAQRASLVKMIVDERRVIIRPADGFVEPTCRRPESLCDVTAFVEKLAIAKSKFVSATVRKNEVILAADTVIVGVDDQGRHCVLGKPPEGGEGREVFRNWCRDYFSGRVHHAVTGMCIGSEAGPVTRSVVTDVEFHQLSAREVDRYWSTGEPLGKAGGYALQGQASLFVRRLEGSFSNVVGLPIVEARELLSSVGFPVLE